MYSFIRNHILISSTLIFVLNPHNAYLELRKTISIALEKQLFISTIHNR